MGRKKRKEGGIERWDGERERAEMEAKEVRHVCKL